MEEPKFRIRTKDYVIVDGVAYQPGQELELPERHALGLIGDGLAEQIPEGTTAPPTQEQPEQSAGTPAEEPPLFASEAPPAAEDSAAEAPAEHPANERRHKGRHTR